MNESTRPDVEIHVHHSDQAPAAIGPYSQAVSSGDLVLTSGQIAIDPATGEIVAGGFAAEARRVFQTIWAPCSKPAAAGFTTC